MENKVLCKEVSPEQARESLIAISQTLPDKLPASVVPPDNLPVVNGVGMNRHGEEHYRSKLISIASTPSPDMKGTSPKSPEIPSM